MKKIKNIVCLLLILLLILTTYVSHAETMDPIEAMKGMSEDSVDSSVTTSIGPVINVAIGLIQMIGTGLSLVMVSILGIKYMMAAPNDKAEVKKQIAPMVVGCVILFTSVSIIQIIANFTAETFG